jgi:hypothetical protein
MINMYKFQELILPTDLFFFAAHIPLYLYPFHNTTSKSRPFEYLRLTNLGVIGALVKVFILADNKLYELMVIFVLFQLIVLRDFRVASCSQRF